MQGMRTDEARRYSDGYFDMDDKKRGEYDMARDKFREFFGSDDFTRAGWDMNGKNPYGRGRDGDSDSDGGYGGKGRGSDSDSDGMEGMMSKIKNFMQGKDISDITKYIGTGKIKEFFGGNGKELLEKYMKGGKGSDGSDDNRWMGKEQSWEGKNGGEWSMCKPGRGRGGDSDSDGGCGRGMCCARVSGKPGTYCVSYYSGEKFQCMGGQKLISSAIAAMAVFYMM